MVRVPSLVWLVVFDIEVKNKVRAVGHGRIKLGCNSPRTSSIAITLNVIHLIFQQSQERIMFIPPVKRGEQIIFH